MVSRLESIRALRAAVVKPMPSTDECTGGKKKIGRLAKKSSKKRKKVEEQQRQQFQSPADPAGRTPVEGVTDFELWMDDVTDAVEEFTGMTLDILPIMPWDKWFEKGISAMRAARMALRKAEGEDDTFDAESQLDEGDDKEGEVSPPLRRRGGSLRKQLKISAESLAQLGDLLENYDPGDEEGRLDEFEEAAPEPVHRGMSSYRARDRAEVAAAVGAITNEERRLEERVSKQAKAENKKPLMSHEVARVVAGIQEEHSLVKLARSPGAQNEVARAVAAVRKSESGGGMRHLPFAGMPTVPPETELKEASVMGGDYGRWKPATAAAGATGKGLAAAIAKKTGKGYTFHSDGNPQSGDGGSALWFEIEPKDSKDDIYYLGIQIKGNDKEDPKWNVKLMKGKGLGSATSVASVSGVDSGGISGAVRQIRVKLKSGE